VTRRNYSSQLTVESKYMGVRYNNRYLRPAVLIVICLLHGGLIIVLVRAKTLQRTSEPVSTIYLILPEASRAPLPRIENSFAPHTLRIEPPRFLRPELPSSNAEATSPIQAAPIDWLAEAQHSAVDIADREAPNQASVTPSLPAGSAPWDPHPHLLESTGHGLKFRIPFEVPTKVIDHCFIELTQPNLDPSNLDPTNPVQTPPTPEQRLQIGCALRKQPARGDLFDSLRKEQPKR
jgi:hypothetical protein